MRYTNGTTTTDYHFVCNWRGDVIGIYDVTGALLANYKYDAWGNIVSVTDSNGEAITDPNHIANVNPIRYRGYYFDQETGFYYLNSRYYDPLNYRFLNADKSSIALDFAFSLTDKNLYLYCDNNPVMRIDVDGEVWDTVLDIAFIAGDVASILANPTNVIGYAELAADVVGLAVPGLTGGGKVVRMVTNSDNVLKASQLVDNVIDSKKAIKSTRSLGTKIHKSYNPVRKVASGNDKLLNRSLKKYGSKCRPDAVDMKNRIIYELKPYNKNSYKRALKQTNRYAQILGDKWKIVIDFYRWR